MPRLNRSELLNLTKSQKRRRGRRKQSRLDKLANAKKTSETF